MILNATLVAALAFGIEFLKALGLVPVSIKRIRAGMLTRRRSSYSSLPPWLQGEV